MSTAAGLFLVFALFAAGAVVLAFLFSGKGMSSSFSRFAGKSGRPKAAGELLGALATGLFGLGVVVLALTGLVWLHPTIEVGGLMALAGFGLLFEPAGSGITLSSRGFLISAWIKLVLALACFGLAAALFAQIKDGYGALIFGIGVFFLFMCGCMLAGAALKDYLLYVADKPLPTVEPDPAVLAELLKPPGALDAAQPPVVAPAVPAQVETPAASPLPGLLAGVVCLSAGMWFRATELVSTEVGYIVGAPLLAYGVIRSGLSLVALARSVSARRI